MAVCNSLRFLVGLSHNELGNSRHLTDKIIFFGPFLVAMIYAAFFIVVFAMDCDIKLRDHCMAPNTVAGFNTIWIARATFLISHSKQVSSVETNSTACEKTSTLLPKSTYVILPRRRAFEYARLLAESGDRFQASEGRNYSARRSVPDEALSLTL